MARTLIRGGCVLTLGLKTSNHPEADVLIEDDVVVEVGPNLRARDAEVVDATDAIVMPGFVDTHRHTRMSLLRNLDAATEIDAASFQADDVYAATLIGLLGALESGTTTVVDWVEASEDPGYAAAVVQAHADAGVRTVLVHPGDNPLETSLAPLTTVAFGSPDVAISTSGVVESAWKAARDRGLRIHAHAGLDPVDGGALASLARAGVLGRDVTLVHCSHLDDADFDAIAEHGARVAVAPTSEMGGSLGQPPLQKLLDRKIEPGLAVDDERVGSGDLFAQMRMANSVQHAAYFDLKLAGKAGLPNLLTTRDLIRYATLVGADAVGMADVTGSIEPGKQADVIVLRTDKPNIYPINDPIGAVVWGVDTSNLDTVFVAGRAVMREGVMDADVGRARALAWAALERVMASVRMTAPTGDPT